jgi:hypothetical protein
MVASEEAMPRGLLRRGERAPEPDATSRLAARVRARLSLDDAAAVSVVQIDCGEPACGGAETVVMVMRSGRVTESARIMKPVAAVGDDDLDLALAPFARG